MAKYILRADDICPTMNWENFNNFLCLCDKYDLKPLLSVIPNNIDSKLKVSDSPGERTFWGKIKELQRKGYDIAIHGYDHKYITQKGGIIPLNFFSEFAGVSSRVQEIKIKKAKSVFKKYEISSDIFVAPGHTFDWNTVALLKKHHIDKISDGVSLYPYFKNGALFVPVTLNGPRNVLLGIRTICLHLNNFNQKKFDCLGKFVSANKSKIYSFSQIVRLCPQKIRKFSRLNFLTSWFRVYYYLRFYLESGYSYLANKR